MRRLKTRILAFLPDWAQLFSEQRHHIYGVFLRGQTEKGPADMGGHTKIHFIYMFGLAMLYDCKVDEGFRHIVSNPLRPYFLLDIFLLVGMEAAQPNGIFELAEGSFYGPYSDIFLIPKAGAIC